jgi:hypothetical protein
MIQIIDNAIPLENQNNILRIVNHKDFKWICVDTVNYPKEYNHSYKPNKKQFEHHLIKNNKTVSEYADVILENLKIKKDDILRSKINLNVPGKKRQFITPHVDNFDSNYFSMIYYIDNSDGKTIIYNDRNKLTTNPKFWWKKQRFFLKKVE